MNPDFSQEPKVIKIEWDEDDPLRFVVNFEHVRIGFDGGIARDLALALNYMADRIEQKITEALKSL